MDTSRQAAHDSRVKYLRELVDVADLESYCAVVRAFVLRRNFSAVAGAATQGWFADTDVTREQSGRAFQAALTKDVSFRLGAVLHDPFNRSKTV